MTWGNVLFAAWPYVAVAVFLVGHVWRWKTDQFGWTARTSQLLEGRWLALASPLFHAGALLALGGHAVGLLVPAHVTQALGVSEHVYHLVAVTGGLVAGVLLTAGLVLLIIRRIRFRDRLRIITTRWDRLLYVLLGATVALGMVATASHNVIGAGYDYRETISVWLRGLATGRLQPELMTGAPVLYQFHVVLAFGIVAVWPFTRLVHVWSVPLGYLTRPYVVYRARTATGGRP